MNWETALKQEEIQKKILENAGFTSDPVFTVAKELLVAFHSREVHSRQENIDRAIEIAELFVKTFKER